MTIIKTYIPGAESIDLLENYEEFSSYYPFCEMQTKRWFVENVSKDWTILDVGANIGYYSILFSRLATGGIVHSFEPTDTYSMLKRNIEYQGAKNIYLHKIGLGSRTGNYSDSIYKIWGKPPENKVFNFSTLDEIVSELKLSRLDCVKIDTDSFDFDVLLGSEKTIGKFNPWIIVELNHALNLRGHSLTKSLEWLRGIGYTKALVLDDENFVLKRDSNGVELQSSYGIQLSYDTRIIYLKKIFEKDFEINKFFKNCTVHNKTSFKVTNSSEYAFLINIDGPQWTYGVSYDRIDKPSNYESVVIEIELHVIAGALGIGCVKKDLKTYLDKEEVVIASSKFEKISISVADISSFNSIVFRSIDKNAKNTIAEVSSIRVYAGKVNIISDKKYALKSNLDFITLKYLKSLLGLELDADDDDFKIDVVAAGELNRYLCFTSKYFPHSKLIDYPLSSFKMERDDAPILRYLYKNINPKRHLEFGTWQGFGAALCASSSEAEIWTLDLPLGEVDEAQNPVYSMTSIASNFLPFLGDDYKFRFNSKKSDGANEIGWIYREAGFSDRIRQILIDSREWDPSGLEDSFDTILIDGGHSVDVVTSDTEKAYPLLKSGGLMIWHDFCPDCDAINELFATKGVVSAITNNFKKWQGGYSKLFWIQPSFLLVGVKA